ncbi:hypothetical protein GCM10007424_23390 [Flavobacterium suaedae]|uniref:AAA+ ATPase domain-containing protein n=1 Tax=Flavobacterium suaedae TaxID=1767027 RepID=A0ABQ1K442_9FLAO|nr:hypothetical protein [Flavobacterium suaedae]GGB82676.1 hypothetical protein GCM10007424_23390 [Flavobacterium suaedae]
MSKKLPKVITVANVLNQSVSLIDLKSIDTALYQAFGNVQKRGVWFIYGGSGSGKSSLALAIARALCLSADLKGIINELEEELDDLDFINRIKLYKMQDVKFFSAGYDYEQLNEYLDRRNSPEVVIINSASYFFKKVEQYLEFTRKYKRKKILIITGHAKGNNPYSELEVKIKYDANKKIFCYGYLANCQGRTIGPNGGNYVIWQEGYEKVRGTEIKEETKK